MHLRLDGLPLEQVCAHAGDGRIGFRRVLASDAFASDCNFVDYAVLPPGTSIGIHTHGADEEIYVVLEGRGVMHLDGAEFEVGPGSLVKNRVGGTHGLRNDGDTPLRLLVVEIGARAERGR
jgi:mannose-6-phosphate isomerase-like protein (cupin superfamily)